MRTFDYLMSKYANEFSCENRKIARRDFITREEHDRILHLHRSTGLNIAEVARRTGRSEYIVSIIVNGKHKFSPKNHDQKTA